MKASSTRSIIIYLSFLSIAVLLFVAIKLRERAADKSEQQQKKTSQQIISPEQSDAVANSTDKSFDPMSYEDQIYSSEVQKDEVVSEQPALKQKDEKLASEKKQMPQLDEQSQKAVEKSIVAAVFNMLSNQSKYDQSLETGPEENLNIVSDDKSSLQDRNRAAWSLATLGDEEALSGLEKVLLQQETPAQLKAIILEGLGYSEELQAKQIILSSLAEDDDTIIRGAIRGLAVVGDEDSVSILSDIMLSDEYSSSVTAEAAMGLGKIDDSGVYDILVDAFHGATDSGNDELRENIIFALGQRDIWETSGFLQTVLDDRTSDHSLQVAVVEAVEDAQGDTIPFLLNNLYNDNSEVRASTAWSLAVAEEPGDIAEELQASLEGEDSAEVRKRLYQALCNQENVDIRDISNVILSETDLEARLAGYDLLARHINDTETNSLKELFDEIVIPELQEVALKSQKLSTRLGAIITLKRAGTQEASLALEDISAQTMDIRVEESSGI